MVNKRKTLVIGLDAACWSYINPLLHDGRMPTLKRLVASGVSGTLHSSMPPWTPTAWSCLITGKNPGKHGIFDMLWKKPGSYEYSPINATHRKGTPFWTRLNEHGIKTGLVNIPYTYPLKPLEGFMICGFGTPNTASEIAYPNSVGEWIKNRFSEFTPEVEAEFLATASPEEVFLVEKRQQEIFVKLAGKLADKHQVNVLVINLMFTDHANHKMPEFRQVQEAYCQTDYDISNLIEMFQPDNVMVISDHGSNRLKGDFMLDDWLRDQGYYVTHANTHEERRGAFNWLLGQIFSDHLGLSGRKEKIIRRLVKDTFFHLPSSIRDRIWNKFEAISPFARQYVDWSGRPDYSSTQVFPGSVYSGLLYLNISGRDSDGFISNAERKKIGREIAHKLEQINDPETGSPVFSNIFFSEDFYSGPETENAPDLILDAYQSGWNLRMRKDYFPAPPRVVVDQYFVTNASQRDFGWHSREGIFVLTGPAFKKSNDRLTMNLPDIPATLLHLYGIPVPKDYDGIVQVETLASEIKNQPIRYQPGDRAEQEVEEYSYAEAEAIVSQLKALGYLD